MKASSVYQLHRADSRPDLWKALKDTNHPLNKAWPYFLDQDPSQDQLAESIINYPGLRKFQFAIVELDLVEGETLVACCRSIPFFWPELEEIGEVDTGELSEYPHVLNSLPDGGWDTIVSRGIRQYCVREGIPLSSLPIFTEDQQRDLAACDTAKKPNALSALSITVIPERRNRGLAEMLIEAMRQTAREEHLRVLLAPLRPTRKCEFPFVHMESYVAWKQPTNYHTKISPRSDPFKDTNGGLPFDPWLRKHIRLGGKVVKIASSSMVVHGSFAQWQGWTKIDFHEILRDTQVRDFKVEPETQRAYVELSIPGGLVPLRVYAKERTCAYTEPNVWLYHEI